MRSPVVFVSFAYGLLLPLAGPADQRYIRLEPEPVTSIGIGKPRVGAHHFSETISSPVSAARVGSSIVFSTDLAEISPAS